MEVSKTGKNLEFVIALSFILLGVVFRIIPHIPNFTPIAAMALFGGVYFSKKTAFVLPIVVMFISDMFLGFYEPKIMAAVYGSFILCVILGFRLKKNKKWHTILASSFLTAFIFFFFTNLAVFAFTPWYAKTLSGLLQCYLMALPFFKNSLLGDIFYTAVFFGAYELAKVWTDKKFKLQPNYHTTNYI
ncbi:MAG: hypothetical protein HYT36_03195 [Candidatus Staskawiczbacteria bacterium]|nr:hypothetical protein [Candidatus Staskawiczbacteria bacterium]